MSSVRRRGNARPPTQRAASSTAVSSSSSPPSALPVFLSQRKRSKSLYEAANAQSSAGRALSYGSSLLESLDLPASLQGLKQYLAGKLEEAEKSLRALKTYVEESELEDLGLTSLGETEDEYDDDEGSEAGGRSRMRTLSASSWSGDEVEKAMGGSDGRRAMLPAGRDEVAVEDDNLRAEISALQAFISSASSFLKAMRDELPSLEAHESAYLQFELSPDARAGLDRFLADHPLPSLPASSFRSRAASSAQAVLTRVSTELDTLRAALASLASSASSADPASYISASFRSSMPSTPSLSDFADLRSYFSAESKRLSNAVSQLKDDTAGSLSAGLHAVQDGAAEFSAYVKDHSHAVVDEAMRMYHAALEIGRERLLRYEELPPEWRNNEHILTGYRYIPIEQWGTLLRSMFTWHNETINIQSHFLGALSLVALLVYYFFFSTSSPHALADPHPGDTAIAVLFVLSAMHCLLCSTTWHLMSGCATSHWFRGAACVDYVGISGLIAASVAGATYYGFYSHPALAASYMCFNFVIGVTGMIVPWQSWFNERKYKSWRIAFFVSLAASAVAPIAHRAAIYGGMETLWFYSPAIPSVVAYLIGLSFYANQFPECCAPGHWHIGASHQLWHIAIVAAVWLHWKAMSDCTASRIVDEEVRGSLGFRFRCFAASSPAKLFTWLISHRLLQPALRSSSAEPHRPAALPPSSWIMRADVV
ncbi:inc metabolism membrane protein [Rhodotorula toruloides]